MSFERMNRLGMWVSTFGMGWMLYSVITNFNASQDSIHFGTVCVMMGVFISLQAHRKKNKS